MPTLDQPRDISEDRFKIAISVNLPKHADVAVVIGEGCVLVLNSEPRLKHRRIAVRPPDEVPVVAWGRLRVGEISAPSLVVIRTTGIAVDAKCILDRIGRNVQPDREVQRRVMPL